MIALLIISGAIGIYPNLLISTTDPAYNLTVTNAASPGQHAVVCLIVALIGMPFVLLYTAGVYYFFRGKATVGSRRLLAAATSTAHRVDARLLAYDPGARRRLLAAAAAGSSPRWPRSPPPG